MENPTHSFRETNLLLQLIQESFCPKEIFLKFVFNISMYSVLNTLAEYIYFYISKNITSYTFLTVVKVVEGLQCILKVKFKATTTKRRKIKLKVFN